MRPGYENCQWKLAGPTFAAGAEGLEGESLATYLRTLPRIPRSFGHKAHWTSAEALDDAKSIAAWTGQAWTTVRVREFRERLGIAPFDPTLPRAETISAEEAATRLGICVRSIHKLIRRGVLPATQLMHSAPWQIPVAALETEAVNIGIRQVIHRRPKFYRRFQQDKTLKLPGF